MTSTVVAVTFTEEMDELEVLRELTEALELAVDGSKTIVLSVHIQHEHFIGYLCGYLMAPLGVKFTIKRNSFKSDFFTLTCST